MNNKSITFMYSLKESFIALSMMKDPKKFSLNKNI